MQQLVVKSAGGPSGYGDGRWQVRVDNQSVFQDIASLTAVANSYSTTELLVESQCDIYIQKIGSNHSAFT